MEITEYFSKHCPVCEDMKPELKKLRRAGFKIKVIDCGKNRSKCKNIDYAPTLVIKKGRKSRKIVGFHSAEEIKEKFESL